MKIRVSYVSNSSSASFVIYNWFDLSEEKRNYIMNYDLNAFGVWQRKKIKYGIDKDLHGVDQNAPFCGEERYYLNVNDKEKYNFGYLNNCCRWEFREDKKRNTCSVVTSMDNFDMEKWLEYNKVDFEETDEFLFWKK